VTGQAGWYDVRVRIYPSEEEGVWPEFPVLQDANTARPGWIAYTAATK
jgi:hypothetical protein